MTRFDTPQSICRVGLARCDITPPVGIYHRMWGAATHDRATGIHRPLTATALVFQASGAVASPDTEQAIIALDHCLFWPSDVEALLQVVATETRLTREQMTIAFSHTHAAGLMDRTREHLPGGNLIGPYLDELARRVARIVGEARQAVRPATLTYGIGHCALASHRDFWDESRGEFVCGFNPDGPADDTVLVARVTDEAGQIMATMVNYACHPTTLAWDNTLISPDFPGAMREVIEAATGAPCVFLQGASGEIGPRDGFVGDPAVADRNGRQLGHAALAALEALPPPRTEFRYAGAVVSGATIGTWQHVPLAPASVEEKGRWRLRRWTVPLPYRAEMPTLEGAQAERRRWAEEEQDARQANDLVHARDCRAMVERQDRWLVRLPSLPLGRSFPFPVVLWQMGDAFWLAVEAEHYSMLQRTLRERISGVPLVVMTLANGARATYLPPAEAYGKNIYQETVAVLAAGCLEQLSEEIGQQLQEWKDKSTGPGSTH